MWRFPRLRRHVRRPLVSRRHRPILVGAFVLGALLWHAARRGPSDPAGPARPAPPRLASPGTRRAPGGGPGDGPGDGPGGGPGDGPGGGPGGGRGPLFEAGSTPNLIPKPRFDRAGGAGQPGAVPSIYDASYCRRERVFHLVAFDEHHCFDRDRLHEAPPFLVPHLSFDMRVGAGPAFPCVGHPTLRTNHTVRSLRCDPPASVRDAVDERLARGEALKVDLLSSTPKVASVFGLQVAAPAPLPKVQLSACNIITGDSYVDEMGRRVKAPADLSRSLVEWVEYHLLNGFDRLIVFDNTMRDLSLPVYAALRPYVASGRVVYHHWPLPNCQPKLKGGAARTGPGRRSSQYIQESVCLRRYASSTTFMAVMDADEYFMAVRDEPLRATLERLAALNPLADAFTFHPVHLARCRGADASSHTTLLRHATRVPRGAPNFRPGLFKVKQIFRADRVWLHFVHYSKEGFPPELAAGAAGEAAPAEWRDYGNAVGRRAAVWRGAAIPQPRSVNVNPNATAFFLHAKKAFAIGPAGAAAGDEVSNAFFEKRVKPFSGSCPRPFPHLLRWLGRLRDKPPMAADARLAERLDELEDRARSCAGGVTPAQQGRNGAFERGRVVAEDAGGAATVAIDVRCEEGDYRFS